MCMHMCSACITQAPTVPLSQYCFPSTYFFLFIVPVSRAICSKVWNCDERGFTVCPPLSAGGEQIFWLNTQSFSVFLLIQNTNQNTLCLFWRAALFFLGCHQAALCCVLVFCYLMVLLIQFTARKSVFVVHPAALVSPGLHHGFIQTAMILCAVSHWWVMMLQFWENWFWLNLDWLISLQLQGNYVNTKHLWTDILYSRNGLFKLRFLSPSLF